MGRRSRRKSRHRSADPAADRPAGIYVGTQIPQQIPPTIGDLQPHGRLLLDGADTGRNARLVYGGWVFQYATDPQARRGRVVAEAYRQGGDHTDRRFFVVGYGHDPTGDQLADSLRCWADRQRPPQIDQRDRQIDQSRPPD